MKNNPSWGVNFLSLGNFTALENLIFHSLVQNNSHVCQLSAFQMSAVHIFAFCYCKIWYNIIKMLFSVFLSFFRLKFCHSCHTPYPPHHSLFIVPIIRSLVIMELLAGLFTIIIGNLTILYCVILTYWQRHTVNSNKFRSRDTLANSVWGFD